MKKALYALASLLVLPACDRFSDPAVCPAIVPASANVAVRNSVTGANVTPGASVVLRNSTYSDSVVAPPLASEVNVGGNRTGTFTVTVRQAGYLAWTKTGVKVSKGRCGARTVELNPQLQLAP